MKRLTGKDRALRVLATAAKELADQLCMVVISADVACAALPADDPSRAWLRDTKYAALRSARIIFRMLAYSAVSGVGPVNRCLDSLIRDE